MLRAQALKQDRASGLIRVLRLSGFVLIGALLGFIQLYFAGVDSCAVLAGLHVPVLVAAFGCPVILARTSMLTAVRLFVASLLVMLAAALILVPGSLVGVIMMTLAIVLMLGVAWESRGPAVVWASVSAAMCVGGVWTREHLAIHAPSYGAVESVMLYALPPALLALVTAYIDLVNRNFSAILSMSERARTKLERSNVGLAEATAEAQRANRAKSVFLANMSHELRTPLNAIIGYSEMLAEDAEDAGDTTAALDLRKIIGAGRHLVALIGDILDLSKIEAGKIELHVEAVDVAALLGEIASTAAPLASANRNTLRLDLDLDLDPDSAPDPDSNPALTLMTDATKLGQIILNLVSNACKFTADGEVVLAAAVEPGAGGSWVVFEVRDSGIGMSPAQLDKVFEAFTQADSGTTRRFGGTGLGLTISKRFCELMGGDLDVSSELGRGSTFTVRLPQAAATSRDERTSA